jgi:hypothetical protein
MRLSELLNREVVSESGRRLGRVHDVRGELVEGRLRVTGLVAGKLGILERYGIGTHGSGGPGGGEGARPPDHPLGAGRPRRAQGSRSWLSLFGHQNFVLWLSPRLVREPLIGRWRCRSPEEAVAVMDHAESEGEPGRDYPIRTTYQPDEPPLEMTIAQLRAVQRAEHGIGDRQGVHLFDDFIVVNGIPGGYFGWRVLLTGA